MLFCLLSALRFSPVHTPILKSEFYKVRSIWLRDDPDTTAFSKRMRFIFESRLSKKCFLIEVFVFTQFSNVLLSGIKIYVL